VRYISHELRTPLNTAFLGLKLLSSELKASKDPKDMERYDTLCDVNMSCTAAVDILNDLLCYEKLESGILELHKEEIVVAAYLKDRISMFSAQARECGVTMTMVTDVAGSRRDIEANTNEGNMMSKSLLPTDSIFADKFKMDQVIRNLMSNALKFTPRGGVVTIKASFVHDRSKFENEFSKRSVKNRSISLFCRQLSKLSCPQPYTHPR
jgi:two-component system, cell cycle sensor histidine kinase PleC